MNRVLIRSASAIAAAGLVLTGGIVPAAASTAQDHIITIPGPNQVSRIIRIADEPKLLVTSLDQAVATAESDGGWATDLRGAGLLVYGLAVAAYLYEYSAVGS